MSGSDVYSLYFRPKIGFPKEEEEEGGMGNILLKKKKTNMAVKLL